MYPPPSPHIRQTSCCKHFLYLSVVEVHLSMFIFVLVVPILGVGLVVVEPAETDKLVAA